MTFCGVDPDLHKTAFAWIDQDGNLVKVACTKTSAKIKGLNAVVATCSAIQGIESPMVGMAQVPAVSCAIEGQEIYPRMKARPNDIVMLANVAGACLGWARENSMGCGLYLPKTWKGSVPKHIHQARILKKLGVPFKQLTTHCVPDFSTHDQFWKIASGEWKHIVDAIGLAQFALIQWQKQNP